MEQDAVNEILTYLIKLTGEVSKGQYDNSQDIFEYTKEGLYPDLVVKLAESFGMMIVQIEGREYRLEQMIEDLNRKNTQMEQILEKVRLLENIKTHLGKFVPESVKQIIETSPDAPDLEKQTKDVSVLFLDVAGYTKMSEIVEPEKMNYLIEKYFSSFLDHIHQNKGDINETAGDGLMIIFQDRNRISHAENAVKTAVAIRERVQVINRDLDQNFEPIKVNIGINSGSASVGSTRFEGITGARWTFTASGSVTNVAARIGALAKNGEFLIADETAHRVQDLFVTSTLGKHHLKNVKEPIEIFKV
ncbi:MAG: adenylate/guanylate cyclase domain-containing protein [Deltaproteobacteria bacterium]|nr:adenylate/guanylate cyclase domain-containing protein [Deltaproteobacteria bacterium]